jgi:hypothetical protein
MMMYPDSFQLYQISNTGGLCQTRSTVRATMDFFDLTLLSPQRQRASVRQICIECDEYVTRRWSPFSICWWLGQGEWSSCNIGDWL